LRETMEKHDHHQGYQEKRLTGHCS